VRTLRRLQPSGRLYWLLLSSGFRTYRFLPVFWREFHPRFDAPLPAAVRARRDFLATQRFGGRYCADSGIVCLDPPQVLRPELRALPLARRDDPHVAFFLDRNPGWRQGDELVCLTEISFENLTPAGRRMWREGERTLEGSRGARMSIATLAALTWTGANLPAWARYHAALDDPRREQENLLLGYLREKRHDRFRPRPRARPHSQRGQVPGPRAPGPVGGRRAVGGSDRGRRA
jgi:hypothetical protein